MTTYKEKLRNKYGFEFSGYGLDTDTANRLLRMGLSDKFEEVMASNAVDVIEKHLKRV